MTLNWQNYKNFVLKDGRIVCNNLPDDFDWQVYRRLHPDIARAGLTTKELVERHYIIHGRKEGRKYKLTNEKVIPNKDKILFIMGNGPSLKEIMDNPKYLNFIKKHDSFGLNSAHRAYKKYNFYPTFFGCFDYVVNKSHKIEFEQLVLSNNDIKEFYFIGDDKLKQAFYSPNVYNHKKFIKFNFINNKLNDYKGISNSLNNYYNPGSSGANALQIGIMKGYKKIVLLGCDCRYIEILNGSKLDASNKLQIVKNIDNNPNYWFDDYQRVGDKYNIPNTNIFQHGSWNNINKYYPKNINIINASMISTIPYFKKIPFKDICV